MEGGKEGKEEQTYHPNKCLAMAFDTWPYGHNTWIIAKLSKPAIIHRSYDLVFDIRGYGESKSQ